MADGIDESRIPFKLEELTFTYAGLYYHLSSEDKQRIAGQCMQYLARMRKSHQSNRCESLEGGPFKTAGRLFRAFPRAGVNRSRKRISEIRWGATGGSPIEPCSTAGKLWDRVYMPEAARANVPDIVLLVTYLELEEPGPFVYTQMDLTPANVLVRGGNFAGFASDELAGHFPAFWQAVALVDLAGWIWRGGEPFVGDLADEGLVEWHNLLVEWIRAADPAERPFEWMWSKPNSDTFVAFDWFCYMRHRLDEGDPLSTYVDSHLRKKRLELLRRPRPEPPAAATAWQNIVAWAMSFVRRE